MSFNIDNHIQEITRLRKLADSFNDDNPGSLMNKIEALAQCLVYIGRVSSFLDGEYKRVYNQRKYEYALAVTQATKQREAFAEVAVRELRILEAEAYEDMMRWRNAFSSTTEEIHSLKLRMKIDFRLGENENVST